MSQFLQGPRVDGNALARLIREETVQRFRAAAEASRITPRIAIVQLMGAAAATQYTRRLQRTFEEAGVVADLHELPEHATEIEAVALIHGLSEESEIHGIQIQTPIPDAVRFASLLDVLDPAKDLDGIHPQNAGLLAQGSPSIVPATPLGGMEILQRYGVRIAGSQAVVVGRSATVGRPMALLLLQANATVTICHTKTRDLHEQVGRADIVVAAAGRAGLIEAPMIRDGAAILDFGVNIIEGRTVGDVEPAAAQRASLFTPVPGGTGPVTSSMLLRNAFTLYERAIAA